MWAGRARGNPAPGQQPLCRWARLACLRSYFPGPLCLGLPFAAVPPSVHKGSPPPPSSRLLPVLLEQLVPGRARSLETDRTSDGHRLSTFNALWTLQVKSIGFEVRLPPFEPASVTYSLYKLREAIYFLCALISLSAIK